MNKWSLSSLVHEKWSSFLSQNNSAIHDFALRESVTPKMVSIEKLLYGTLGTQFFSIHPTHKWEKFVFSVCTWDMACPAETLSTGSLLETQSSWAPIQSYWNKTFILLKLEVDQQAS